MSYDHKIPLDKLKNNGQDFIKDHPNGKSVLRATDGKKNYQQIAKELNISNTSVSTILNTANKLQLAERIRAGVFKRKSGVMSYIPEGKVKRKVPASMDKIMKKAKHAPKSHEIKDKSFSNLPLKNIDKMTMAYQNLYLTENTLRELIRKVLGQVEDWWERRVNKGIKDDVKDAIEKFPYDGYERRDELEYTHLGQLKEIITAKNNWNDFLPHLNEKNKASFSTIVDKAIPSRNSIGHCISLKKDDLKYVDMRFQDILKMIK